MQDIITELAVILAVFLAMFAETFFVSNTK